MQTNAWLVLPRGQMNEQRERAASVARTGAIKKSLRPTLPPTHTILLKQSNCDDIRFGMPIFEDPHDALPMVLRGSH
jgi:hypothetical protein